MRFRMTECDTIYSFQLKELNLFKSDDDEPKKDPWV